MSRLGSCPVPLPATKVALQATHTLAQSLQAVYKMVHTLWLLVHAWGGWEVGRRLLPHCQENWGPESEGHSFPNHAVLISSIKTVTVYQLQQFALQWGL